MKQPFSSILILCLLPLLVKGYQPTSSRREVFVRMLSTSSGAALASTLSTAPAQAVLSSKYCAAGVGEGCNDLSEGNELIKSLQEKSAAKREQYAMETRNAYYMKNYPDYFASTGKTLVRKPDGSFITISDAEVEQLKIENKLTYEIPMTKGGKFTDVTQKPIWVMKE